MPGDEWDWSQHVVDHVELHASDYDASVSFYATVLAPLGIPSWPDPDDNNVEALYRDVGNPGYSG